MCWFSGIDWLCFLCSCSVFMSRVCEMFLIVMGVFIRLGRMVFIWMLWWVLFMVRCCVRLFILVLEIWYVAVLVEQIDAMDEMFMIVFLFWVRSVGRIVLYVRYMVVRFMLKMWFYVFLLICVVGLLFVLMLMLLCSTCNAF